jgi:hypothetical protein
MTQVTSETILAVAPAGASAPDSLTASDGSIWVEYGNTASSRATPGTAGSSTIVQYSEDGSVQNTYTIGGEADGLKVNPATSDIWVLQNQDGNSSLTIINRATNQVSSPLTYDSSYVYGAGSTHGFDDVAFSHGKVFLSETNPANSGDPVVVQLTNGNGPFGTLVTNPVLRLGDTGTNLLTGQKNQPLPVSDPDSLKSLPDGSLILTSEKDGAFTFIHNPGTAHQTESFITLPSGVGTPDDAVIPTASSGTFYVSSTTNNEVFKVAVSDLNMHDLYASVGNSLDQIDLKTGAVTQLATGLTGAHGLLFQASTNSHMMADDKSGQFAHSIG